MEAWYYAKEGRQEGPVPVEQLRALLARTEILPSDLVWKEGMPGWQAAGEISALRSQQPEGKEPAAGQPERVAAPSASGGSEEGPRKEADAGLSSTPAPVSPPAVPTLIPPPPTSGMALASMICGVLALPLCWVWALGGIPAVICGHLALKKIRTAPEPIEGRGMALAGLVLGWLAIGFQVVAISVLIWVSVSGN